MKKIALITISILLIFSFTACSGTETSSPTSANEHKELTEHANHHAPNGDLREVTSQADILPQFLADKDKNMQLVYQLSAQYSEVLEYIPCYCGCGRSAGHTSNLQCFVHEIREDGSLVWDDHGTRCNVCLETAVMSIDLKNQGKSLQEIRDTIDEKYKEGYAPPTPTPQPPAS
jgi:hypothetical protein